MYILACDGGATKTEFLLVDEAGKVYHHEAFPGLVFGALGREGFAREMKATLLSFFEKAKVIPAAVESAIFGMTNVGEIKDAELHMQAAISAVLSGAAITVVNDAVVGWAGSLAGAPGINVVAGTGSIAYGESKIGKKGRAGGWMIRFSDEGSCSWVGAQLLAVFFKQADGRLEKTPLYEIVRNAFAIEEDMEIVEPILAGAAKDDAKLAELQRLALLAYEKDDPHAKEIYTCAAKELAELVFALKRGLCFSSEEALLVSYSGGLFRAGDCIMHPFRKEIEQRNGMLLSPKYPPLLGALIYILRDIMQQDQLEEFCKTVTEQL